MGNCVSKYDEQQGDNPDAIEITKKVFQALVSTRERLLDVVCSSKDQQGEDKLEKTLDDIDELYEKYTWFYKLGRQYVIKTN